MIQVYTIAPHELGLSWGGYVEDLADTIEHSFPATHNETGAAIVWRPGLIEVDVSDECPIEKREALYDMVHNFTLGWRKGMGLE